MKKLMCAILAVGLMAVPQSRLWAQSSTDVAVISVTSYDEMMADIGFLGQMADRPQTGLMIEGFLAAFTNQRGLEGMDKSRPWGAVVRMAGPMPYPVVFLPVTDIDALLGALGNFVQSQKRGDVYELSVGPQSLYAKHDGNWAFLGQSEEHLNELPADPSRLLGDLPETYNIAVRLMTENVPPEVMEQIFAAIEAGQQMVNAQNGGAEPEFAVRMREQQMAGMKQALEQADEITAGLAIDASARSIYLDGITTARPGTQLAESYREKGVSRTNLAGFDMPEATMSMLAAGPITEQEVEQAMSGIALAKEQFVAAIEQEAKIDDEQARAELKEAVESLFRVAEATIRSGKMDMGMVLQLDPQGIWGAAGGHIAQGEELTDALKKVAALAEKEEDFPGIQFDAASHQGVSFHTMEIPVDEPEAQQFLGERMDLVIGIGSSKAIVGIGKDVMAHLRGLLDSSASQANKEILPMQFSVSLKSIFDFAGTVSQDPQVAMFSSLLEQAGNKDHVTMQVTNVERGQRFRLNIEEGILKALGQLSNMAGAGAGAGF